MKGAVIKTESVSSLLSRFGDVFERRDKHLPGVLPTGIAEIDEFFNGFPRGAITEIHGAPSSGRTSLLLSALAVATMQEETCALVDASDTFDLSSAASARVACDRILWVRCSGSVERAFKATDLLLQSGGFGLVALNLADMAPKYARRIISSWWFRFRRAIESTPTALIVVTPVPCIRSCAALVLEVKNEGAVWPNSGSLVLKNNETTSTIGESRKASTLNLSLVTKSTSRLNTYYPPPTHSHLLQGIHIRVNQERPTSWTGGPARFSARLH